MNQYLLVKYTDGRERETLITATEDKPMKVSLDALDITVTRSRKSGLDEYTIAFVPTECVRLTSVSVRMPFAENCVGNGEKYIYDNSYNTNMFVGIRKYDKEDMFTQARDLVCVKSSGGEWNAAFTSFCRFFTEFYIKYDGVCANIFLEDKPVTVGETYVLESLAVEESDSADFCERYTTLLSKRYGRKERKPVPFGWSSWSCMYGNVKEENLIPQVEAIGKIVGRGGVIQVDDGWQGVGSFNGTWTYDREKFPSGVTKPAETCRQYGMTYGLWMAPALIDKSASAYAEQERLINRENGVMKPTFGDVYPLDLSNPEVIRLYCDNFRRMKEEYGASYFKIDFLANFLSRLADGNSRLSYPGGYSVEVYRNFLNRIRETVGDDVFLLGCGCAIGEGIGIFDGLRTSADITWNGVGKLDNIKWWDIFRNNIQNIILRSYYNNVLITDPDGLVVRGYRTPYEDDDVALSYEEAQCYATAVAMSGGHILLNEEVDKLGKDRLRLFTHILPTFGKAARPADFFEFPYSTEAYVRIDEEATAVALYNLSEEEREKILDTQKYVAGNVAVIDMWTNEIIAKTDGTLTFPMKAHSCRACLIKKTDKDGNVAYDHTTFWCGYAK